MARQITVDIVSDVICPWCFVGKRRFESAVASAQKELNIGNVVVRWRPFQLDPSLPLEGVNKLERYHAKFGAARMNQMLPYMNEVGLKEGIHFSYGGRIAATINGHRLLELAWQEGGAPLQDKVQEELFKSYFEKEANIGDLGVLASAAARAGMDEERVRLFLAGDEKRQEVMEEISLFRRKYAITGVPYFIVDGKYRFSGAQDPDVFMDAFREIAAAAEKS